MLQVTTKSRRWVSCAARQDADRQGQHDDADDGREAGDDLAERGHRNHVAIAHRRQRDDGPIHRVRDGAELVGLRLLLGVVHRGSRDEHATRQDHERGDEAAALAVDHVQ
jgi:hypothetical protein